MSHSLRTNAATRGESKERALRSAAGDGDIERVKLLVAAGANIHDTDNAALLLAALAGQAHVVRFLLNCGAAIGNWAEVALLMAERNGQTEVAALLARKMGLVRNLRTKPLE